MLLPVLQDVKYCWAWDRVYVKANGRCACWCDLGEPHTIIHKNLSECDFVPDVVNSPEMRRMRLSVLEDRTNYIDACNKCCCMSDLTRGQHARFADDHPDPGHVDDQATTARKRLRRASLNRNWTYGSLDYITEIQLEPSFPCNLRCPGCLQGYHPDPLSTEKPPYVFPLAWFESMIVSLQKHHIKLHKIAYVGRGEPTLNKDLPQMVAMLRRAMPNTKQVMDTNSTQKFQPEFCLMNKINCSIDGSTPAAYATYRRGGDFTKAVQFMRDAVTRKRESGSECEIRWKYILFNTTDSDELLNLAQQTAKDIGVDKLDFVIPHSGSADRTVVPTTRFDTMAKATKYLLDNPIFLRTVASYS